MDPCIQVLKEMYCFKKLAENDIMAIRNVCREERFRQGDIIFSEGDGGDRCLILLDGQMEIRQKYLHPDEEIEVYSPFQIYAESALFDTYRENCTALAITSVRLLSIARKDFEKIGEKSPEMLFSVIRAVSERIRKRSERLLRQLQTGTRYLDEICLHLQKESKVFH